MHHDIFGSAEKPFSLVAEPKYFFRSASHGAAFDQLHDAIRRRDGFILVTGELGSGKTTLVRSVLEQVDRTTFTSVIEDPSLSEEQLLRVVLQDFGLVSRDEMKRGRLAHASAYELLTTLADFLASLGPLGASALLVIDEAQEMPLETLDQISALAGSGGPGSGAGRQLQIVLVGQPILKDLLASPLVRELDTRVTTRLELKSLTPEETSQYVSHRLMVAGAGPAVDFAPAAVTAVHRYSGGVPRLINMLCEGAMSTAEAEGATSITPKVVDTAAARLEFRPVRSVSAASPWSRKPAALAVAAVLLLALMGAAYISIRSGGGEMRAAPPAAAAPAPQQNTSVSPPVEAPPARAAAPDASGTTTTPPADGSTFSVLVASFRQANEATALLTELKSRGLPVREVRVVSSPRGLWHQVLVGPYPDAAAAARGRDLVRQIRAYADAQVVPG